MKLKKDAVMKIRVPQVVRIKLKEKAEKNFTTMTELIRNAIIKEARRVN